MNIGILLAIMFVSLIFVIFAGMSWWTDGIYDNEISTYITLIAGFILLVSTCLMFAFACRNEIVYDKTPYATEKIIALQDNNLTHGKIYYRRGYIDESMYYQYMVINDDESMIMNKIKAEGTKLYYSDDARVEWYKGKRCWWIFYDYTEPKTKLYIPKGSIIDDINIDLE